LLVGVILSRFCIELLLEIEHLSNGVLMVLHIVRI
jgi:hypothetical protein